VWGQAEEVDLTQQTQHQRQQKLERAHKSAFVGREERLNRVLEATLEGKVGVGARGSVSAPGGREGG